MDNAALQDLRLQLNGVIRKFGAPGNKKVSIDVVEIHMENNNNDYVGYGKIKDAY